VDRWRSSKYVDLSATLKNDRGRHDQHRHQARAAAEFLHPTRDETAEGDGT